MSAHGQQAAGRPEDQRVLIAGEQPGVGEADVVKAGANAACRDDVFDFSKDPHAIQLALAERGPKLEKTEAVEQAVNPATMDHEERIKFLAADVKKGAWSEDGKKVWSAIFDDLRRSIPGATDKDIQSELIVRTAREINKLSKQDNVNRLVQFVQANGKDPDTGDEISTYNMAMAGDNAVDITTVGKINWTAERATYQKEKAAVVETLKKEALKGTWDDSGRKACRRLFELVSTNPDGTTIDKMKTELQSACREVNQSSRAKGSSNYMEPGMALTVVRPDEKTVLLDDEQDFLMVLSRNQVERRNTLEELQKPGGAERVMNRDNCVKLGSVNAGADGNALKNDEYRRVTLLANETTQGFWSPRTQQTWRRTFDDLLEKVLREGTNANGMKAELSLYTEALKAGLQKKMPGSSVDVVSQLDPKTGGTKFAVQLNIVDPVTKQSNRGQNDQALREGRDTRTSVELGTWRFRPEPAKKNNAA